MARRAGPVIDACRAGAAPEVGGSDLDAPQMLTAAGQPQICLSHQGRDRTCARAADAGTERAWALDLRHRFGRAGRRHHARDRGSPATFARRRVLIEQATDRRVCGPPLAPKRAARRRQPR